MIPPAGVEFRLATSSLPFQFPAAPNFQLMKSFSLLTLFCIAVAFGCASTAPKFKPDPGFVSLYNGKDLTGWGYRTNLYDGPTANLQGLPISDDGRYSGTNGVLAVHPRTPRKMQIIWTTQEFPKDFILKLEFRATVNADSGIFIRRPQLQCRDYPIAGPDKYKQLKNYKPQDWNEIVVTVTNGVAHCVCNGEVLEEAMKVPATGPIGLEGDRGLMEYRHIQVKELK
jgi:hypothetical protein